MGTLPVLLKNPALLLIGGGKAALQKARVLIDNDVRFSLISEQVCDDLRPLDIPIRQKRVDASDLREAEIVVDATGDPEVARLVLEEKKQRSLLFNCVDRPELCDFYFSALLRRGRLKVAISTEGSSPAIGQVVRDKIAAFLPEGIDRLLEEKQRERESGCIDGDKARDQCRALFSTVYLIGCGPGDVDLLTLKAYRTIRQMDVVLYDHLLTPQILDLVPGQARRIPVGKQKGGHSLRQEQINAMLYDWARRGLKVARLKGGDPFIFGRGAEEAEYLVQRGVRVEVISGLSSATAGPACAGIPPTARGFATNLSIVSAHLAGNRIHTEWIPLLRIPDHTTVVLMGLSFSAEISRRALEAGVPKELPVAIVSNASRPNQQVTVTDLNGLPQAAQQAERPAILIFGRVVALQPILSGMASESLS